MNTWMHEPPSWELSDGDLRVTTGSKTDFWTLTHYGFVRHTGHLWYQQVVGDFSATVNVCGHYRQQYDHAGLMVRLSEDVWIKAGVEYLDQEELASAVVTRTYSDWSVADIRPASANLWVRIVRSGGSFTIETSLNGEVWRLLRLAWLTEAPTLQVGVMCASPDGPGFDVTFRGLQIEKG